MASDKTPNYDLPLFNDDDHPTWTGDFNTAMSKVDTSMKKIDDNSTTATGNSNIALQQSSQALETATTANGTADNALNIANTANGTANAASTKADQALAGVDEAKDAATSAAGSATSAQQSASAAQQSASNAEDSAAKAIAFSDGYKEGWNTYSFPSNDLAINGNNPTLNNLTVAFNNVTGNIKLYGRAQWTSPGAATKEVITPVILSEQWRPSEEYAVAGTGYSLRSGGGSYYGAGTCTLYVRPDGALRLVYTSTAQEITFFLFAVGMLVWLTPFGDTPDLDSISETMTIDERIENILEEKIDKMVEKSLLKAQSK